MTNGREWVSPIRQAFVSEKGILGFAWVGGVLLFVALTGLAVWLLPFSVGTQMAVVFHTVLGLLVLVFFALWQLSHWLATRKSPRKARKISAYIGFWLLAVSALMVASSTSRVMAFCRCWASSVKARIFASASAFPATAALRDHFIASQ